MKAISYLPDKDELLAEFGPRKVRPSRQMGPLALWYDDRGNICAVMIREFWREREEFQRDLNQVKLEGIWKGYAITDKDIEESRKELLRKLEENW